MKSFVKDLLHPFRRFARHPGLTLAALLTLAVGIGANTAIWSLVDGVLLAPLPYRDGDRIVHLFRYQPAKGMRVNPSMDLIRTWREQSTTLERVEDFKLAEFHLSGGGEPALVPGLLVSPGLLPFLGIEPVLGHGFTADLRQGGDTQVAILSHAAWQRRFGGDREVLGRTIQVDGAPRTVVGVLPPRFPLIGGVHAPEILVPREGLEEEKSGAVHAVARLGAGVDLETARAELRVLSERQAADGLGRRGEWTVDLFTARDYVSGGLKQPLWILQGAVAIVLLLVCANLAGLAVAQGEQRRRELALRAVLGASRRRLLRQLLTESVALALVGGLFGWILAMWTLEAVLGLLPEHLGHLRELRLGGSDFVFTCLLSIATGLLFGLLPALHGSRAEIGEALQESGGLGGGRRHAILRQALVGLEVAAAVVLLVGAASLVVCFVRLDATDPGFAAEGLVTVRLELPPQREADEAEQIAFYDQLWASLDGVGESLALAGTMPPNVRFLSGSPAAEKVVAGRETGPTGDRPTELVAYVAVSPGYFETLGIPLLRGRDFLATDRRGSEEVVVLNQTLATRLWPDEEAVGRRLWISEERRYRVVGVVADVPLRGPLAPIGRDAQLYLPYRQQAGSEMLVVARGAAATVVPVVKARIREIDPEVPIHQVATAEELLATSTAEARMNALLMTLFALAAAFLAAVGIAGVVVWAVHRRIGEIGLRMALGARGVDIVRHIVRGNTTSIGVGILVGLAGAWGASRFLESLVEGVETHDPAIFLSVAGLMALIAGSAAWIPARRAARVDPIVALRQD